MNYPKYTTVLTSGALATTLMFAQIAPSFAQDTRTVTLDAGTVIPVKLRDTLSSVDSRKGDRFIATLQSDEAAKALDLPRGTNIEGTVTAVQAQEGKNPGVISLSFKRIMLPNESTYPIQGSLIGLDNKSVNHNNDGRLVAKTIKKNKSLTYAGYGAGAGLLLGAITKGNTILDTLLGGGLGYLLGTQDKSHGDPKNVTLKPNTEMGVRLDRSVKITTYTDSRDNDDRDRGYAVSEDSLRTRTDRNDDRGKDDRVRLDGNRDAYEGPKPDNRADAKFDASQALKQYTDLRDNGRPIRVIVDGTRLSFLPESRPFIANGVLMVPAVPALKAANAHYTYTTSQFKADGFGDALSVNFDSRIATASNARRYTLPATVQRRNGTTYVPIQFLAIVTGEKLTFDRDTQTMELGNGPSDAYDH